tara:strand:- start:4548 stop:5600 length:1053 start_codon:yes stop_codon:yes gene_type:complete
MSRILITGGAGYIGSHTSSTLIEANYDISILDSFINSSPISIDRIQKIHNIDQNIYKKRVKIFKGDVRDKKAVEEIFQSAIEDDNPIQAVIHFAGVKSVEESVREPLLYWDINVGGSRNLVEVMDKFDCHKLIFSSSATIYGIPKSIPIRESAEIKPINPYGESKAAVESMLKSLSKSNNKWNIVALRYFNPIGAHPSGLIGEDPFGTPNNLFPYITQVASGRISEIKIFGNDWPTKDGTCIRDYIHPLDLAEGHLAALNYITNEKAEFLALNLGSGNGYSVLDIISAFEEACGKKLNYKFTERRAGDVAVTIADATKALEIINWKTKRTLSTICKDNWLWQVMNPNGYE